MSDSSEEPTVLLKGEFSSMVSCWHEYLCLMRSGGGVELSSRGYDYLAECSEFEVETEDGYVDHQLPECINGVPVQGINGDWVVGGPLVESGIGATDLLPGEVDKARGWLKETGWADIYGIEGAWGEICKALGVAKAPPL